MQHNVLMDELLQCISDNEKALSAFSVCLQREEGGAT